jgi:hypothetical protein
MGEPVESVELASSQRLLYPGACRGSTGAVNREIPADDDDRHYAMSDESWNEEAGFIKRGNYQ